MYNNHYIYTHIVLYIYTHCFISHLHMLVLVKHVGSIVLICSFELVHDPLHFADYTSIRQITQIIVWHGLMASFFILYVYIPGSDGALRAWFDFHIPSIMVVKVWAFFTSHPSFRRNLSWETIRIEYSNVSKAISSTDPRSEDLPYMFGINHQNLAGLLVFS